MRHRQVGKMNLTSIPRAESLSLKSSSAGRMQQRRENERVRAEPMQASHAIKKSERQKKARTILPDY